MRTDIPSGQRMTRTMRSASLGRAPVLAVRRTLVLALLALAFPAAASAHVDASAFVAVARPTPVFVVSGHGWGHGVGMGQYGAYGYARHGVRYRAILAHYYPGTTIGATPVRKVRVRLAQ